MPERENNRNSIGPTTRLCAVYGQPIRHSASPAMQNAGIAALGLDWRYLAFEVPPRELASAIAGAAAMRFVGLNLTVPHKLLAFRLVDVIDPSARGWGAVNTIRFDVRGPRGKWTPVGQADGETGDGPVRSVGFNTDADALVRSLKEDLGFDPSGKRILLLGAGGAGRVAGLRLAEERSVELFLVNRTRRKATTLAREIAKRSRRTKVTVGYPNGRVDLVLNATSLGLKPKDDLPFDDRAFQPDQAEFAYDMIYRPAETPFLRAARAGGCRTANGIGMLLHQGARALEIWSGSPAPVAVMDAALRKCVFG